MKEQCNKVKRTSYFNSNRGSYLDEERQEYVYEVLTYDENDRPIPSQVRVAVTKDNTEIIKDIAAFRETIVDTSKLIEVDPQTLLAPLKDFKEYEDLLIYLQTRYWEK